VAIVNDDGEVFPRQEEGDDDVGADVAESAGDEDFLVGVSLRRGIGRRRSRMASEQRRGNDATKSKIKSVRWGLTLREEVSTMMTIM
jgi:hypothetical protein